MLRGRAQNNGFFFTAEYGESAENDLSRAEPRSCRGDRMNPEHTDGCRHRQTSQNGARPGSGNAPELWMYL